MNTEIIKDAFKKIDSEMMQTPVDIEELENLRKAILFRVHFIEQLQVKAA